MVVGIDGHGQRIGGARDGMRRLEHLPGVQGVEVGVVVAQTMGGFLKNCSRCGPNPGPLRGEQESPPREETKTPRRAVRRRAQAGPALGLEPWRPLTLSQPAREREQASFSRSWRAEFPEWALPSRNCARFFQSDVTLRSALEPNRACAVARPTKQDSASGRSDSSSAIQFRKHDQNGTRYCEVVQ